VLPGDGSEVHDYIYVGDVARANVLAMTSAVSGESFNIVSGRDETLNDVVATLLRITGSPVKPEYRDDPTRVRFTTTASLLAPLEPGVSAAAIVGRQRILPAPPDALNCCNCFTPLARASKPVQHLPTKRCVGSRHWALM
jgi:hypothetical protein